MKTSLEQPLKPETLVEERLVEQPNADIQESNSEAVASNLNRHEDRAALERELLESRPYIVDVLRGFRVPEKDIEDIAQNAFLYAIRGFKDFREDSKLTTWLYKITKNAYYEYTRSRRSREDKVTTSIEDLTRKQMSDFENNRLPDYNQSHESTDDIVMKRDEISLLNKVMNHVNPLHRQIVRKIDGEGQAYKEVAKELNIPIGTVQSALSNTRKRLKKLILGDK